MPTYLARVELYNAEPEDYEGLHKYMLSLGFRRTIPHGDGSYNQLPDGTYVPKRAVIFIKFAARYLTMQTDYPGIARLFLFANSVNAHGIYTPPRPGEYPARPSAL
ncbi:Uncharacterised protein [Escherichia coli]|uniref:Uncharacterized protein n=1 Tax=Escherichia coli TaxID=562 RepID=A0A376P2U9_ECOLX|nr:Uncharacterised protein [Escherichia coli]